MPQSQTEDEWLDTLPLDHDEFSTSPAEKAAVLVMPAPTGAGCGKCPRVYEKSVDYSAIVPRYEITGPL